MTGHGDYIRAGAASPASQDLWATGSYDHAVKLWDVRSGDCSMTLDHGAPVEDVVFLPSGTLAVSAGGNYLCVWDILGGGRLLRRLENHQKTVTSARVVAHAGSSVEPGARLVTGSLDGHVKVYSLDDFRVTHASRYPAPVLSVGVAPDSTSMAVGLADGKGAPAARPTLRSTRSRPLLPSRRSPVCTQACKGGRQAGHG